MGLGDSTVALDILLNAVDNTKAGVESGVGGLGKIGSALGMVFAATTIVTGAAVAMGTKFVDQFMSAAGAAHEMSLKFGTTVEQSSKWLAAGTQIGVSNSTITTGFQMLSRSMNNLDQAFLLHGKLSASQVQTFKELGVSIMDVHGNLRPLNDVMLNLADKFKAMPDGAEKAGLAMKLFGRSGTDMLPILDQGSAGLAKLMANAQAAGLVMSEQDVIATKKFHQELATLKMSAEGAGVSIGRSLMPMAISLFQWIDAKVVPVIQTAAKWLATTGVPWVSAFVDQLVRMGEKAWPSVVAGADAFWKKLQPLVPPLKDLGTALFAIAPSMSQLSNGMNAVSNIMSGWPAIISILVTAIRVLTPVLTFLAQNANLIVPAIAAWYAISKVIAAANFAKDIYIMAMAYRSLAAEEGVAAAVAGILDITLSPLTITLMAIAAVVALVALAWNNNWGDIQGQTKKSLVLIQAGLAVIGPILSKYVIAPMEALVGFIRSNWGTISAIIGSALGIISALFRGDQGGVIKSATDLFVRVASAITGIFKALHIPMPHFSFSGSMNPADWAQGKIPSLAVQWYGGGGNFIANSPTLIGVGERGAERVSIRPLGAGAGGSDGLIININGPLMLDNSDRVNQLALEIDRQRRLAGGRLVIA